MLNRAHGLHEDTGSIVFDEIVLNKAYEMIIKALNDDEEVVVLMPAKAFIIRHGPKRTVLYWLCRNAAMTEKINGFLEGERGSLVVNQHRPTCLSCTVVCNPTTTPHDQM